MKIKIDEYITIEINFPDDMQPEQFRELTNRMKMIQKMMGEDVLLNNPIEDTQNSDNTERPIVKPIEKRKLSYSMGKRLLRESDGRRSKLLEYPREDIIDILKAYYSNDMGKALALSKKMGRHTKDTKSMRDFVNNNLKKQLHYWNITPQDIGIKKFPTQGEKVKFL